MCPRADISVSSVILSLAPGWGDVSIVHRS
jgi:hypothetical protein